MELTTDGKTATQGSFLENRTLLTENLLVFNKQFKYHKIEALAGISTQMDE